MQNFTLYVHNINEKIKINDLKRQLYDLFSQSGKILEVIANKGTKKRGQAFIVFSEVSQAENAMKKCFFSHFLKNIFENIHNLTIFSKNYHIFS